MIYLMISLLCPPLFCSDLSFILDERDTKESWRLQYPADCHNELPCLKSQVKIDALRDTTLFYPPALAKRQSGRPKRRRGGKFGSESKKRSRGNSSVGQHDSSDVGSEPQRKSKRRKHT